MPMAAPSFTRTTRAPGGVDAIAAVTVFALGGATGGGAATLVGARVAGATVTVFPGPGIQVPRVTHASPPIAARPIAMAEIRRPLERPTTWVSGAAVCAACVNVVGLAGTTGARVRAVAVMRGGV